MKFRARSAGRTACVEVGGCSNGELVVPLAPSALGCEAGRVFQVARQPGDDQHPGTISLWDVSGTRLVTVPRDLIVNVCDDVVVAYTVRQEAGCGRPRHGDLVAHDPLDTGA